MRAIFAFGITFSLLAPVAISHLDAGPEQRQKLFAAGERSVVIDGATIELSLDKSVVDTGGTVHLTLHADKKVRVGIVALGSSGTEGDRVPSPPSSVLHKTITIDGTADVPITLAGAPGIGRSVLGMYSIYVMTPAAAAKVARLQANAHQPTYMEDEPIPAPGAGTSELYSALYRLDAPEAKEVGRIEAFERPVDPSIAIAVPDHARRGESFAVTVMVANPSAEPLVGLALEVLAPSLRELRGPELPGVSIDGSRTFSLAPHESRTFTAHVMSPEAGTLGLQARVICTYDEDDTTRRECDLPGAFYVGAFDAVDIDEPGAHIIAGG